MAKVFLAIIGIVLMAGSALPPDCRGQRRTHPAKPAADAAQNDKSSADKTSADIDRAMDRSVKSICRGC
jgi:hypothetical protein